MSKPELSVIGDVAHINLWYPRIEGHVTTLEIGLMDVRASDGIRVSYDFERDGWVIRQESYIGESPTENWTEVAFVQSWALEQNQEVVVDLPDGPGQEKTSGSKA